MSDERAGAFTQGSAADLDDGDDDDDLVPGSEGLPEDIPVDDLAVDEDPDAIELPDDDLDAPLEGEPFSGDVPVA